MSDEQKHVVEDVPAVNDVEVHPLSYNPRQELTVVVNVDETKAWLMPTKDVPGNFPFRLLLTDVARLAQPYAFKDELAKVVPTSKQVRNALWAKGIVAKKDLRNTRLVSNALATVAISANKLMQSVKEGK